MLLFIQRLNDSCIIYVNACAKPIKKNITCKREQNIVGLSEIYVGDKFAPVQDFKCRTKDLMNLTCTFQQPSSYHPIVYRLSYTISTEEVLLLSFFYISQEIWSNVKWKNNLKKKNSITEIHVQAKRRLKRWIFL